MSLVELLESKCIRYFHSENNINKDEVSNSYDLPLYESRVSAGFPSPAEEYIEGMLDLNKFLVSNPPATFFMRNIGDSMICAGIYPQDILIVDRSIDPKDGKIVIASLNDNLEIKRFTKHNGKIVLKSENTKYPDVVIDGDIELVIWGVVTCVLHRV